MISMGPRIIFFYPSHQEKKHRQPGMVRSGNSQRWLYLDHRVCIQQIPSLSTLAYRNSRWLWKAWIISSTQPAGII